MKMKSKMNKHSKKGRKQKHRGGSQGSDLVNSFAKTAGQFMSNPETPRLPGNPASLNLYQTTGGSPNKHRGGSPASDYVMARAQYVLDETNRLGSQKGGKRSKKSKKSKKSKGKKMSKRKSKRRHMGGGSATDFRDTLYSRIVNGDRADAVPFFNAFTNEEYISQQDLANEPNMVANPPYLQ
jgi:hypothetical protein